MNYVTNQRGATLVLSLIFLALLTIAGVASMRMITVDNEIAGSFIDRQAALQAAEAALTEGQIYISSLNFEPDTHVECIGCAAPTCTNGDANCFPQGKGVADLADGCKNGLCFFGSYTDRTDTAKCTLDAIEESNRIYQQEATWATGSTVSKAVGSYPAGEKVAGVAVDARYLIEFQCFERRGWPKFRVTALANGRSAESRVMLQSTVTLDVGPSIPAVMSVRGRTNRINCTSIGVGYLTCPPAPANVGISQSCSDATFSEYLGTNIIDPSSIPAYSLGEFYEYDGSGTELSPTYNPASCGATPSEITAATLSQDIQTTAGSTLSNPAISVATMSNDQYFEQYFSTTDRTKVFTYDPAEDDIPVVNLAAANILTASLNIAGAAVNDPVIIVVTGNLDMNDAVIAKLVNQNAILIVDGNLTMSGASNLSTLGMLYVTGDATKTGSSRVDTVIAIEGDLTLETSLFMSPLSDPGTILGDPNPDGNNRSAWQMKQPYF